MERNATSAEKHFDKLFPGVDPYLWQTPINPETGNKLSSRLKSHLATLCRYSAELNILGWCFPNIETVEDRLMIRLWLNGKDLEKGFSGRVTMKPVRAIRHMFPYLSEKEANEWVDDIRLHLGERKFTLKSGQAESDFVHAYTHDQARFENPRETSDKKNLANSCMRYSTKHFNCRDDDGNLRHPVEAYASGDFTIYWLEDQHGKIAARSVAFNSGKTYGPIYGVCDRSINRLESVLQSKGFDVACHGDWISAKLQVIEARNGGYIAPYLDTQPRSLEADSGYLVVSKYGSIDASGYGGILNGEEMCTCENCGTRYNPEEEGGYVDEMHVCDPCYENSHPCEYYDRSTFEEVNRVYINRTDRYSDNGFAYEYWSQSACDDNAEYINGDYWGRDDCFIDYKGNYLSPEQEQDGEYFRSEWDGEYYPASMMCETVDGDIVSKLELDESWQQNKNGLWEKGFDLEEVA